MSHYGTIGDDYYVNMNLATEMELPQNRETLLHYFEQMRRRYPELQHFYSREKDEFVLEGDKDAGHYRWTSIEPRRINSGAVNPESFDDAVAQHRLVTEIVPYDLSVTSLDCESLSVSIGFDFAYRGNHNAILAKAIGVAPGLEAFAEHSRGTLLANEPTIQISLDEECRTQCRISFETRTSAFQVRTGDYPEEQLSVYLTVRRYDSLPLETTYSDEVERLSGLCKELTDEYLVPSVLQPLQEAIAIG
ncbi:MAG: hypothetical protein AAF958_15280 [Planctomycetota bacterium]